MPMITNAKTIANKLFLQPDAAASYVSLFASYSLKSYMLLEDGVMDLVTKELRHQLHFQTFPLKSLHE